jgi:acyl carrier protein
VTHSRDEIEIDIREIAAVHLGATEGVEPDSRLVEDLDLDSLQLLTLSFEVEDHFEIILEPNDEAAIVTVGDLIDTIDRLLTQDSSSRAAP